MKQTQAISEAPRKVIGWRSAFSQMDSDESNLSTIKILNFLKKSGPKTGSYVADALAMKSAAVRATLKNLSKAGCVIPAGFEPGVGGKRVIYQFNKMPRKRMCPLDKVNTPNQIAGRQKVAKIRAQKRWATK